MPKDWDNKPACAPRESRNTLDDYLNDLCPDCLEPLDSWEHKAKCLTREYEDRAES